MILINPLACSLSVYMGTKTVNRMGRREWRVLKRPGHDGWGVTDIKLPVF